MSAASPRFSVIIVAKDPGPNLAVALESVWAQADVTAEVIVVDGGSTDGTQDWLEREKARVDVLIAEPDHGIYEAMNKGLRKARGEWIYFLGADDRLVGQRVLSEVYNWALKTEAGTLCGEIAYSDGRIYKMPSHINAVARNFAHHQGTFYRRSLFDENGLFDESFQIMGDYEFNTRLWKNHVRFKAIPIRVAACAAGGKSDAGQWVGYREEIRVRHKYYNTGRCWFWDILSVVRCLRKKVKPSKPPAGSSR
jgi:glycosyltransferase involved in cell wall biosynthesis